ncbi:uncharacterized protein LOC128860809 [Anastrepha ludens]|uniref:uncharacterized protein LOC128860809 n=1 Tax=Anastrepha ludens TaxID=28586 RepID=UPI0023AF33C8|nr:uncharacterized protein LOC128860809 [Anastrepha ludens]
MSEISFCHQYFEQRKAVMKGNICKVLLLVVLLVATATALLISGNGRPSCTTQEEINIRIFRNNWDPTSYWKCEELNAAPVLERCPEQMAYLDGVKNCVDWAEWHWEEPTDSLIIENQL